MTMERINLTRPQKSFLRSYLDCLDEEAIEMLLREDESGFVGRLKELDFDDGECAHPSLLAVARNLDKKGAFSTMDVHFDRLGDPHLYVAFNETGAKLLYQVGREACRGRRPRIAV